MNYIPLFQDKYDYKYFAPKEPILYKVGLGMGYLELPQGISTFYLLIAIVFNEKKLKYHVQVFSCSFFTIFWARFMEEPDNMKIWS